MPLVLNVTARDPALLPGGTQRVEVRGRLTIGRGADNDLVLPDPERQLSKNHCLIQFDGRSYTLTDTSTNGVYLNDSPERLMRDVPVGLIEGCILRIGAYEMTVVAIAPDGGLASSPPGFGGSPGFADYSGPNQGRLDDGLFGDPFAAPLSSQGFGAQSDDPFGFETPAAPAPGRPGYAPPPRHDDPFGFGGPSGAAPSAQDDPFAFGPSSASPSPFGQAIPDDDALFGPAPVQDPWPAQPQHDHTPSEQMAFSPSKATTEAIPDDWDLSDLGVELNPQAAKFTPSPQPDPGFAQPAMRPATPPPQPVPPQPATPQPVPPQLAPQQLAPQQPAPPTAGGDALVRAFLAATGVPPDALNPADGARLMQVAGEMLQAMSRGLIAILAARASTKQEFRIERTMIGAARNNPLKILESPEEALQVLLSAQTPGFTSGPRAVEEALDDIKSHQLAVLAGMQMALTTVIARFDPAKLEKRLEQSSLLESVLPAARKARYWELFKTLYKEIAGELEDDFQKAFGTEFARAYREQIERL
jgi:type VI secretion system protein